MATTRIMPLHAGKGRTVGKAISDIIDYVKNPDKTDHGRLITSYQCDSRVADAQFLLDKQTYAARTGRVRGKDDVIAYHLRQSFVPGEITPEEANRLGRGAGPALHQRQARLHRLHPHRQGARPQPYYMELRSRWTATASSAIFWGSTRAVRRLSDTICIENGYSIVETPKPRGQSYNKWLGDAAKPSHREHAAPCHRSGAGAESPPTWRTLLAELEQAGCTVDRRGKHHLASARLAGKKPVRLRSLGEGYTQEDLTRRLWPGPESTRPAKCRLPLPAAPKVNLLVDIQAKLQAGQGQRV